MKLFPKLALLVSGLLLGAILYVSISYYRGEAREIQEQTEQEERQTLQNLTHIAGEAFLTEDDLLLVEYIRLLVRQNLEMASASVVDTRGQIRAHSDIHRIGQQEDDPAPNAASVLILSESIKLGRHVVGTACVEFSQKKLDDKLHLRLAKMRRRFVSVTLIGLLVSLAACFAIALSWTRPIKRLAKVAEQVGQGKWSLDLKNMDRRGDEVGFLAQSFQSMAMRLGELDRMKEDFVSSVTHELQSPLSAIESFLNLIDSKGESGMRPDELKDCHKRIRVNTQRLARFVSDLLDVSALERGKVQLNCKPLDVGALAQEVLSLFEFKLQEKGLSSRAEVPPNSPKAQADIDKIRQVLINLVSNAMKYTPAPGHIEISVEDLPAKKQLRVCVTDTGIGIDAMDQLKIFSKFEQVQSAKLKVKGAKGTGLGLAICRELIQLHGGEIGVTSRWGHGSTFYFTLPAAEVPPALAPPCQKERFPWETQLST
jgi:signal transduction histidine kinase